MKVFRAERKKGGSLQGFDSKSSKSDLQKYQSIDQPSDPIDLSMSFASQESFIGRIFIIEMSRQHKNLLHGKADPSSCGGHLGKEDNLARQPPGSHDFDCAPFHHTQSSPCIHNHAHIAAVMYTSQTLWWMDEIYCHDQDDGRVWTSAWASTRFEGHQLDVWVA